MSRELSFYLNLIRLCASLSVFLGHCTWLWTPGLFEPFRTYGFADAVLAFFVLSGFVIGYAVDRKEPTPWIYAVNRAARIYSVALPALLSTFLLDTLGRHLCAGLYSASWGYSTMHPERQFLRSLFFVNEIWWWRSSPGSNGPFWSLAYEVCYYVAFGITAFMKGRRRFLAAAAVLTVAGPMVAVLFPVWLLGYGCYRLSVRGAVGQRAGWLLCVGCLVLVVLFEAWATNDGLRLHPAPLFAHRWQLLQDGVVALCLAGHLLGAQAIAPSLAPVVRVLSRPVNWAAGASFTLYLFHFPIAQFLAALDPWPRDSWPSVALILGGTIVLVLLVAELTERRKEIWRRGFSQAVLLLRRGLHSLDTWMSRPA